MAIEVIKPGLATSVQDAGRPGYYNIGIPISGGLDQYSLRAANLLVGNDEGAAVLEATLLGPELLFRQAAIVAVTGAEAAPKLNGKPQPRNESFAVRADDRLGFDFMRAGARIYIAIAGGIDVAPVLGSRSTYALGALGGFAGRKLAAGDVLSTGAAKPSARAGRALAADLVPAYPKSLELRVLPGLYFHRITDEFGEVVLRGHLDGRTGGRPHRLSLPQGAAAGLPRAQAAVRRRLRSIEHRRCRLSLRLDPGARRP